MRNIIIFILVLFVITLSMACYDLNDRVVILERKIKTMMEVKHGS